MKILKTDWLATQQLIITQISGNIDESDISQWKTSLHQALEQVEDNGRFKIFVNLHGFEAMNIEAHKKFRSIIPATLANYGWKVGYVNLFEEAAEMKLDNIRGIQCIGAAHVHQDETKIEKYEERFGNDTERFFIDAEKARNWIESL